MVVKVFDFIWVISELRLGDDFAILKNYLR